MRFPFLEDLKFAESWDELTEKQLQEIAYAFEIFSRTIKKDEELLKPLRTRLQVELVKNILRTNNWIKVWIALHQLPPEVYNPYLEFLWKSVSRTSFPAAFKIGKTKHYPPGDRLNNLKMKEFSMVDALYFEWRMKADDRYLNLLCAALYRPAGTGSPIDGRVEFYQERLNEDARKFKKVSFKKKLAIAYTYLGCRNYIGDRHPHLFPKPVRIEGEPPVKQKYEPFGKLIAAKSDYKPYELEKSENLNVYKFLGVIENELIEMKNQKKK